MNRRMFFYSGVLLAAMACAPAAASSLASQGGPQWMQVCTCLDDRAAAERTAENFRARLEGLRTMLVPVQVQAPGGRVLLYELFVLHPDYGAKQLCRLLGMASCRTGGEE